ncbi:hypothetical protein [Ottowia sp.]|uniref:hypothetical protein n=1 Tax=Ottowia sp. TaxID=1898956 RepID=UPI0025F917A8|nr:hypothetical protein [Ottowia sp.]MBK6616264.1 hypothetical protein [Ottowia sp.]
MTRNIDLGRALTRGDIEGQDTFPMNADDEGAYCYICGCEQEGRLDGLEPLTCSSGVFTRLVLCQMDAPVWVCLEHLPFQRDQFEGFAEELRPLLRQLVAERDRESTEDASAGADAVLARECSHA